MEITGSNKGVAGNRNGDQAQRGPPSGPNALNDARCCQVFAIFMEMVKWAPDEGRPTYNWLMKEIANATAANPDMQKIEREYPYVKH